MKSSRVAKRYARALLGLSDDHAQLETWGAELERLARIVDAPEIALRLASPELLARGARCEAMAKIAERLDLSFPLRSFAVVVARHGRIAQPGRDLANPTRTCSTSCSAARARDADLRHRAQRRGHWQRWFRASRRSVHKKMIRDRESRPIAARRRRRPSLREKSTTAASRRGWAKPQRRLAG